MLSAKNESLCLTERNVEADRARLDLQEAKEMISHLEEDLYTLRQDKAELASQLEGAQQKLIQHKESSIQEKQNSDHKVLALSGTAVIHRDTVHH